MEKGANFSACRKYRYVLWRTWTQGDGHVIFIGLNPSTADENKDDPTIRRCIGFAKDWGYGGINMLNIFAFRATDPKELMKADSPIGLENNHYLRMYCDPIGMNIACWGTWGNYLEQGKQVRDMLGDDCLHCFGLTKNGQPKHPLYLPKKTELIEMSLLRPMKGGDRRIKEKEGE